MGVVPRVPVFAWECYLFFGRLKPVLQTFSRRIPYALLSFVSFSSFVSLIWRSQKRVPLTDQRRDRVQAQQFDNLAGLGEASVHAARDEVNHGAAAIGGTA